MIESVKIAYRYFLIMGIGAVLLLLSIMVPVLSSSADFSIYNNDWNGCSGLGLDVYNTGSFLPTIDVAGSTSEMVVHNSFDDIKDRVRPSKSSLVIIGPDLDFTDDEGAYVHDFLLTGGIVLLADDVGTGNTLLAKLDTPTRISGLTMLDLSFMKNSRFSVTTELADHEICKNSSTLLLNMPSTIIPSPDAISIVNSSRTSWLSSDGNEGWDEGEQLGPFSLLTLEDYGLGQLIVLSEPSLLINQMRDEMDNDQFVKGLIDHITKDKDTTIIDEFHRDLTNPVQFLNLYVSDFDPSTKVGIMVGVSLLFIFLNTTIPRRSIRGVRKTIEKLLRERNAEKQMTKEPLDVVMERHPDWDRRVLQRLVREIEGTS